jgi:tryptophanyl-tRNA synthetase
MTAVTDPARQRRSDLGHPEVCNVYKLHEYFNKSQVNDLGEKCRTAQIGCVDCKKLLAQNINEFLSPFRDRRAQFASNPSYIQDVLEDGKKRAAVIARQTISEVKQKIGLL